jgi:hypothetical protein
MMIIVHPIAAPIGAIVIVLNLSPIAVRIMI